MGKWSISDLDKSKTEQSITNETIRLENCRQSLNELKNEYARKKYEYMIELSNIEDDITTLETSIASGEKFIKDCKNHLKDFENAEIN